MKEIKDLRHVQIDTNTGGNVFVLDKGEVIDSEAEAMLQALHSRSTGGLLSHLKVLEEKGADNFMSRFYVGYGHKSIGDCGSTTIFIEGVSMLVAKAIQDFKLYSGQESSTRYVDFSKQTFIDPTNTDFGNTILEKQRQFYLSILEPLNEHLKKINPIKEGEKEVVYEKAIAAKAFDIARGFLPSGASTNLAWHANLRQIADRIMFLRHHPLKEVRDVADAIEKAMLQKHPNSFSDVRYEDTEKYQELIKDYYYHHDRNVEDFEMISNDIKTEMFEEVRELFEKRPNSKTELPQFLNSLGEISFRFKLDFGSFRDIQRHRAINQRMPLVTTDLGFNKFYLDSLPEVVKQKAVEHLTEIEEMISKLDISKEEKQYFIPMGYNISNYISGTLPAMIYMAELRATRFVHPTLREIAKNIAKTIHEKYNIPLYTDLDSERFDVKRGEHDISIK